MRLTPEGDFQAAPTWSPDGNWIAYQNGQPGRVGLARTSTGGGGRPIQLKPPSSPYFYRPQWSPRGDWITWIDRDGLSVVSPDGQTTVLLSKERPWPVHGWSKDGSKIYGIRQSPNRHLLLASIDIQSKTEKVISDLGPSTTGFHGFSLAPDGKSFATSMSRTKADIWILEGLRRPARLLERLLGR